MSRTFRALAVRNYRRYATGQLVANTGIWMQRVAQDWLVLELSGGSATLLGITVGLQFLPTLLLSMLGGTLADRFPRRRILMATSTTMGVLAIVLGAIVLTGAATVPIVMGLALLLGAATAVDAPTRQAFVSEMVDLEDLPNAVALGTASFNLGRVLGPSVAGLLIAAVGTGWVFVLNSLAFSAVLVALLGVRTDQLREPVTPSSDNGGLREGLRYIKARPELVTVLVVAFFVGTFGLNFNLYLATMTSQVFERGAETFGVASTVLAVGSLAGSLAAARRGAPRLRLVILAAAAFGAASVTVALMPTLLAFLLALPLVGVTALTVINAMQSYLQINADPEVRGRVLGVYMLVFLGGTPLGSPLMGWVGETLSPRWAIALGGVVSAAAAVVAGLLRMRRTGMGMRAHLTPRPHLHLGSPETLAGIRERQPMPSLPSARVVAVPLVIAALLAGGWFASSPVRAAEEQQLTGEVAFRVVDPDVVESSGMVEGRAMPGITWLVEDSGNEPVVFGINANGRAAAVVTVEDADNRDWEAMAPGVDDQGAPTLWIGDIGDNDEERDSVVLYEIPEPTTPGEQSADPKRYELTYEDGPHDAESLLVDAEADTAYLVTKDLIDPAVYVASGLAPGKTTELTRLADAPRFATDAAFDPGFTSAVVRTYTTAYLFPTLESGVSQVGTLPPQPQGETIAWSPDSKTLLSGSEGRRTVVHRVTLPDSWLSDVAGAAAPPAANADATGGGLAAPVALAAALAVVGGVVVLLRRAARRRSPPTG